MTSENPHMDNANEKIINWLDKNRDAFGRKILCVCLDMEAAAHIAHVFLKSGRLRRKRPWTSRAKTDGRSCSR
jgi:hypothetical protein